MDAAATQIASTRALLEQEGISAPGDTHRVLRGLDHGLADTVRELVREARTTGATHVRIPTRALASTALFSEPSSTRSGYFGPVVLDVDIPHEAIFSHYSIDGELLSGEAEIVAIFPDGHIEVAINRVYDSHAGDRIPDRTAAEPPEPPEAGDGPNPLELLLSGDLGGGGSGSS